MSKPIEIATLKQEHQVLYPRYQALCAELVRQIQLLIDKEGIQLAVPLQSRAKDFLSISDKIEQGRFKVKKSLNELQDFAGIRIITLFKRDALKVSELVNSNFEVVKRYDTQEKLDDTEFGYSSIHMICQVKDSWLDLPSFSDFKDLKFELQIRTLSQHSWAEASNIFQYKKEEGAPKPLRRTISRISALLETVDLEFERLISERETYKLEIETKLPESEDELLNVDSLKQILDSSLPLENKKEDEDYSILVENLQVLGFQTTASLKNIIDKHLKKSLIHDKEIATNMLEKHNNNKDLNYLHYWLGNSAHSLERLSKGVYHSHCGLVRDMLDNELGLEWSRAYDDKIKALKLKQAHRPITF